MWNKRRDEEPPKPISQGIVPSPAQPAPNPVEVKKEATPMSSMPVRTFEPEGRGDHWEIGQSGRPDFQQGRSLRGWPGGRHDRSPGT